jgi:hypothetical protein
VGLADAKDVTGLELVGFNAVAIHKSAAFAGAIDNQDLIVMCPNPAVKRGDGGVAKADCGGAATAQGQGIALFQGKQSALVGTCDDEKLFRQPVSPPVAVL